MMSNKVAIKQIRADMIKAGKVSPATIDALFPV